MTASQSGFRSLHMYADLYADDTKMFDPIRSIADCEKVQQSLTNLECWSRDNNLDFNSSKCKNLR